MLRTEGGWLKSWRQIVTKRGFTQDWKILCRNGITGYKKDETTKMEEMHQQKVEQMIKSAEGSAGHLHKITKPKLWRRRSTVLGERRGGCEVVGLL